MFTQSRRRFTQTLMLAAFACSAVAPPAAAHPGHSGSDLSLAISITEDEVVYNIFAFGGLLPGVVPVAGTGTKYSDMTQTFVFTNQAARDEAEAKAAAHFDMLCPVFIDGVKVQPVVRDLTLLRSAQPMARATPQAFPPDLNLVLAYPTKGAAPDQVRFVWRIFINDTTRLMLGQDPSLPMYADLETADERTIVKFTAQEPEFTWHAPTATKTAAPLPTVTQVDAQDWRPLILVILGVVGLSSVIAVALIPIPRVAKRVGISAELAGLAAIAVLLYVGPLADEFRPPPTTIMEDEAQTIFETLHRNIYRAFDYKTEDDVYDALAETVDGALLDAIYTEVYQSLIMREEGGAVAKVHEVTPLDVDLVSAGRLPENGDFGFSVQARWRVLGVVTHYNHSHERTNEYQATYVVAQRPDGWKITGMDMLASERIPDPADPSAPSAGAAREPGA